MSTLFDQTDVSKILERIDKLKPESQRHWGKMNVAQILAHCNVAMEKASGTNTIKPVFFIGRLIGSMMKKGVLSAKPFGKNSPTDKSYIFPDNLSFEEQKSKAVMSIRNFAKGGPEKCTTHPHPFFGHFTPEQWGVFQWKHIDHHLRQFGV